MFSESVCEAGFFFLQRNESRVVVEVLLKDCLKKCSTRSTCRSCFLQQWKRPAEKLLSSVEVSGRSLKERELNQQANGGA